MSTLQFQCKTYITDIQKLINKSIRMSEWLNLIAQANTIIIETLLLI